MAIIAGTSLSGESTTRISGGTTPPGRDFISVSRAINQDASFTDLNILVFNEVDLRLTVKVFRVNGLSYDFVGESQEFTGLTSGVNSLVFSSPIPVLAGDLICFNLGNSSEPQALPVIESLGGTTIWDTSDHTSNVAQSEFNSTLPSNRELLFEANGTPSGGSGTITIDEAPKNNHPYQRGNNGTATVDFNVTYTGTPTALQYRLLDASDDSTVVQDWATFESSPSGGSSTLSITRSPSLTPIHVEVRFSNEPSVADLQTNDWYVGDVVLIFGQSLSEDLNTDGAVTPPAGYFVYSGGSFTAPTTGVGANAIASAIITGEGCPVFIVNTGVGGTALTQESGGADYWNRSSGGSLWPDTINAVNTATAGANEIAFAWWHQGTKDSLEGVTKAQYLSALNEFFNRVRGTFSGKGGGALDVIMATFGRDTRGTATNASHQAIRDAQISYIASDANAYPVNVYTSQNKDGVHATDAAYIELGQQVVTMYYVIRGLVSGSELAITSAAIGDTASEIDITFGADLLNTDSAYSTEGVHVEDDGTPLTVTSFEKKSARVATITVSETPAGTLSAWLAYGKGSTDSGLTYPRSEAISLPNSAGDFSLVAGAFSDYEVSAVVPNQPPVANAGPDQSVAAGARVQLNATLSTDPEDGAISKFGWEQVDNGADAVVLEFANTATPEFTAPSSLTAQTLEFRVQAQDSEGATSTDTVIVNVASLEENAILSTMETLDFELVTQGNLVAYKGRANREVMQLKPSSTSGIVTAGGYLDVSNNGIVKVEIIADGKKISNENSDSIKIEGARILARLGDLDIPTSGRDSITPTFMIVLYVGSDTRGLVVASNATSGYKPLSYRVEDAA